MKISTLMVMVTLSASCFATPVRTALEPGAGMVAPRVGAAPVAPPAPDVAASGDAPQQWEHIALPRSHRLDQGFLVPDEHLQT